MPASRCARRGERDLTDPGRGGCLPGAWRMPDGRCAAVTGRILPFGDRALLVEVDRLDDVLALHARLAADVPDGVVDLVPAARTVLVHVDPRRLSLAATRAWIARAGGGPVPERRVAPLVELPIVYDGPDLDELADALGIRPAELAERHAACEWTVAFTGFAPGFGYLVSADWRYDVPRRATPRTRVPAGAVGLAAEFSGAYPRESPGGWQLIGTTSARLFDADAVTPALLAPGARVRFAALPAPAAASPAPSPLAAAASARPPVRVETAALARGLDAHTRSRDEGRGALVVEPGLLATVQDQGRPGHAAEGIATAGAADRAALRTANRLLGNREDAAGVEITMGGFRARAESDLWIAVTGAWGAVLVDGHPMDPYAPQLWPAGSELHLDWFAHGTRAYLAIRGGVAATGVAGSCSTDTLSGLGPAPLRAGDRLTPAGPDPAAPIPPDDLRPWGPPDDTAIEIALAPGPRADWLAAAAGLFEADWTVSNEADRVGIRLDGPALRRIRTDELPSEGMLPGAIQVPPDGRPVILGPDGPVTGGYPVIAVVADASRDALAQARPGTRLRFRHARPGA
ncbi:5-oxoprolinase/urea amidolyase family protein [Microbacterium sp.]|uniref:5-oxoprolinase subunit B/C family protein n=1 Tax=Microbacterium sp. TaxID=51671 RepID=UPI0039E60827